MPEYLSPGVYVEELSTGPRPIEGVSTSTLGFVGQTERGPTSPRLVTSILDYQRLYGGYLPTSQSYLPYAIKGFFDNGGQRAYLSRVTGNGALPATAGQDLIISAIGPGGWGNRLFARIDPGKRSGFRLTILYYVSAPAALQGDPLDPTNRTDPRPDASEVYDNLSAVPESSAYVLTSVNGASHLVTVEWSANHQAGAVPANMGYSPLLTGADGAAAVLADYQAGLTRLDPVDGISILCIPDEVRLGQLRGDLRDNCELNRYRFAIQQVDENQGDVGGFVTGALAGYPDSSYVGLYYPWIHVVNGATGEIVKIPPGGHVAGIYARTDDERGVHKAPANEEVRGLLLADSGDIRPLEFTITKGEQDELNPRGVNVIRDFRPANRGIRVWGARTRSSDPLWKYVNVRRLFIFLEKSIDEGTQWVVFEPNDEPTWAAVRRSITNFLIRVWRDGALMGPTQDDAFFVKCDRTTMTEDDILNGRLICYVGVAPVRPAEFVIIRISQKTIEAPQ
jgi:phage tail sheath protein FI